MPAWFIPVFIGIDIVVTAIVLTVVFKRRAAQGGAKIGSIDFAGLHRFAEQAAPLIEERLRANWSGDATTLPLALGQIIDELEQQARAQNLALDRSVLKTVVLRLIEAKHLAKGAREAMQQVA